MSMYDKEETSLCPCHEHQHLKAATLPDNANIHTLVARAC
jgi:hypothetical protein